MNAMSLVILGVGVRRHDFASLRQVNPVYAGRELATVATEMLDCHIGVILQAIHRDRYHPPLVPVGDVPGTRTAGKRLVAAEVIIFLLVLDHLETVLMIRGESL